MFYLHWYYWPYIYYFSIFSDTQQHDNENTTKVDNQNISNGHTSIEKDQDKAKEQQQQQKKRRDVSAEREVTVKFDITFQCLHYNLIVYNFDGMACTGSRHGINGKLRGRPTMDWAPSNARLSRTQWTCKWRLNLLPQSKNVPNSETLWLSLTLCAFLFFEIFPKLREHNTIVIPQSIAPRCSPNWKRICPSRSPFTWKAPWHMTRRFWWPIRKPNAKRSTILSWMDHPRNRLWVSPFKLK